jgi:uncharacterized protein YkwD
VKLPLVFALLVAACPLHRGCADDISLRILDEINFARTRPRDYAQVLPLKLGSSRLSRKNRHQRELKETIAFLRHVRPLPPLGFSSGMALAALDHVRDEGPRGIVGHRGSDFSSPWKRMARHGKWIGRAGENIACGYSDPELIVAQLIIDAGVPGRGHRKNIFTREYTVAGVACGAHAKYGMMSVVDFAGQFIESKKYAASGLYARD